MGSVARRFGLEATARVVGRWSFVLLYSGVGLPGALAQTRVPDVAPAGLRERGIQASYTSLEQGAVDVRRERLIALAVPAGRAPTSLLPAGRFRVEWSGGLAAPVGGNYSFAFAGTGRAWLSVNGEKILEENATVLGSKSSRPVRLNRGPNRISLVYESPESGDAQFRLDWAGAEFRREPVPPHLLEHDASAAPLQAAERFREGRVLFAERHCSRCHAGESLPSTGTDEMPELHAAPPLLDQAGARFRTGWLAAWIADPHAQRPQARMPRLYLRSPDAAADITAYLAARKASTSSPPDEDASLVSKGGQLFAELECIACHRLSKQATAPDRFERVSLDHVGDKWHPAALVAFLREPAEFFPATRMPQFNLSAEEATALAAFLQAASPPARSGPAGNATRGKVAYREAGCAQCHEKADSAEFPANSLTPPGPRLRDWHRGCMADTAAGRGIAPEFSLTVRQCEALRTFGASHRRAPFQDTPAEFALRQFEALRCGACHERDGRASTASSLESEIVTLRRPSVGLADGGGEETSEQQAAPSLTWAGEKLKPDWMRRQIAGEPPARSRPWLKARMPGFGRHAAGLATGIAEQHGVLRAGANEPGSTEPQQIARGAKLVGPEGLSCGTCHAIGVQPAVAPFGAPGVNLALSHARLNRSFLHRWMDNPARIEPATKMPKFTDENGRLLHPGFEGDPSTQWDALYAYLRSLSVPP